MKVLVTSSTGLTGRAVVQRLSADGAEVRAMVHSETRSGDMMRLGASETVVASIEDADSLARAMKGVDAVFYICPTAHPREGELGCMAADTAVSNGVTRFVYQSVLNSIEPELIHHRQKLMVEQHLLESPLRYTILRPAAFMQNLLASADELKEHHVFTQRFYTGPNTTNLINLIDADDYAAIASRVTLGDSFDYGCYDLAGPKNLSAADMLSAMSEAAGTEVTLRYIPDDDFIRMSEGRGMAPHTLSVLLAMFRSYNRHGFRGNPTTSRHLLGHTLTGLDTFLHRII